MPKSLYHRAVSELGLNVPIARMEDMMDGTLRLHLSNGRIVEWTPTSAPLPPDDTRILRIESVPDDLTAISGIGPANARLLREAGYTSFDLLARADPADLDRLLNLKARRAIRDWLAHHPQGDLP